MKGKFFGRQALIPAAISLVISGSVSAMGVGNITLHSALNQPLKAEIELSSVQPDDGEIKVTLGTIEDFRRAGIDRPFSLSEIKFKVEESAAGKTVISLRTRKAIREPFLNFLIEVDWSSGRVLREYTVLLDPPTYDRGATASVRAPVAEPSAAPVVASPAPVSAAGNLTGSIPRFTPTFDGSTYGPVAAGETLWSVAQRVRGGTSVTVQQGMIALVRANPEAFLAGNVNGLKQGYVLRVPDTEQMATVSAEEALALVKKHNASWDDYRQSMGATTAAAAPTAAAAVTAATAASTSAGEPELRLLTPRAEGSAQPGAATQSGTGPAGEDLQNKLAMALEKAEAKDSANEMLRDKLSEAEDLIESLQRLVTLKDDKLAAMQAQLSGKAPIPPQDAGVDVPEVAADEAMAPAADTLADVAEQAPEPQTGTGAAAVDEPAPATLPAETPQIQTPEVQTTETQATETRKPPVRVQRGGDDNVMPALGIVDMIPGGIMTVAAAGGALLLALIGFLVMRRRGGDDGDTASTTAPTADLASADDATVVADDADAQVDSEADQATVVADDASTDEVEDLFSETAGEDSSPDASAEEDEDDDDATMIMSAPVVEVSEEPDVPEEEEDDPLAEVNVYLAYERFDQAEEMVKNVIDQYPDRHEYKKTLLEVYYASGNKAAFEDYAHVLNEAVNGEGEHWEQAVAMWNEMSPDRALFEAAADGAEDTAGATGSQSEMIDLGAGDDAPAADAEDDDNSLDFDLSGGDEDVLDVTAGGTGGDDVLDVTAGDDDVLDLTAADDDVLDVTAVADDDDVLDVTAGGDDGVLDVTAGSDDGVLDITAGGDDEVLDLSAAPASGSDTADDDNSLDFDIGGDGSEDTFDITASPASADSSDDDMLDITAAAPAAGDPGDDLLDVTNEKGGFTDDGEDLLDVTAAGQTGLDSEEELLDVTAVSDSADELDDLSAGLDFEPAAGADAASAGEGFDDTVKLDVSAADDGSLTLEIPADEKADGELTLDLPGDDAADEDMILDVTASGSSDDEVLDLGADLDLGDGGDMDLTLNPADDSGDDAIVDLGLGDEDLSLELNPADADDDPSSGFTLGDTMTMDAPGAGDDADSLTAEIPTDMDEIGTKLDLAKAYIELYDADGARSILDEVIADGDDQQKSEAEALLQQL